MRRLSNSSNNSSTSMYTTLPPRGMLWTVRGNQQWAPRARKSHPLATALLGRSKVCKRKKERKDKNKNWNVFSGGMSGAGHYIPTTNAVRRRRDQPGFNMQYMQSRTQTRNNTYRMQDMLAPVPQTMYRDKQIQTIQNFKTGQNWSCKNCKNGE